MKKGMKMGMDMKKVPKSRGTKKPEKSEMAKPIKKKAHKAKTKKDMYP